LKARLHDIMVVTTFWGATYLLRFLLTIVVRWKVTGRENVPRKGGLIVVSNHLANADPPVLSAGIASRRIRYLAKIELYKLPMGILPRAYGAIPVRRFDADAAALLATMRVLRDGEVLGMFPEGTRSATHTLGRFHPGTAAIALRTGVPILPCAITGTQHIKSLRTLLRRPRITVSIGAPIYVEQTRRPTDAQIADLTERLRDAVAAQLPAQYVGPYTGDGGEGG
jgi:1-acyl-sn-glycerol-3-phosphate acyltransferase